MEKIQFRDIWTKYWYGKEIILKNDLHISMKEINLQYCFDDTAKDIKKEFITYIGNLKNSLKDSTKKTIYITFKTIIDFAKIKSFQFMTTDNIDILKLIKLLKEHFKICNYIDKYINYNKVYEKTLGNSKFNLVNYEKKLQDKFYKVIIKYFIDPRLFNYTSFEIDKFYDDSIQKYKIHINKLK